MNQTANQYKSAAAKCRDIFSKKNSDYGTAWRILRVSSLTDQVFIKAQRIRTLQETGTTKVGDGVEPEFLAIVNYSVMALIQLDLVNDERMDIEHQELLNRYDAKMKEAFELMENKNHDYGEAWRDMRVSSLTDLILMKLLRIKQIEDNQGKTLISEGIDANFFDMINYAIFALIKMESGETKQ
ncbi:MAG: DUF1599 domain-containing protein [Flavobacteriales bacterium]